MRLRPTPAQVAQPITATPVDQPAYRAHEQAREDEAQRQRAYAEAVKALHGRFGQYASRTLPGAGAEEQQRFIADLSREHGIPTPEESDARQVSKATAEELNAVQAVATSFERSAGSTTVSALRLAGRAAGLSENPTGYYKALDALDEANVESNGIGIVGSLAGHVADPVWLGTFGAAGVGLKAAGIAGRSGRWGQVATDYALAGGAADLVRGTARGDDSGKIKQDIAIGAALGVGIDAGLAGFRAARGVKPRPGAIDPPTPRDTATPRTDAGDGVTDGRRAMYDSGPVPMRINDRPPVTAAEERLAEDTLIGRIGSALRRQMTSAGGFPAEVFAAKTSSTGGIESTINESAFNLAEYHRVARDVYGSVRRMTPEQTRQVDNVLKGDAPMRALPAPLRPVVSRMRGQVDALSRELIRLGAVEGELAATVGNNVGEYLTRSYRIFDDPSWARRVPEDIRNRAKSWLRAEYPNRSEAQLQGLMDRLLYPQANSPLAFIDSGRLGRKDLSILTRRKNLPPELRALWGEYRDARVNYTRSVEKMAHLVGNHRFLTEAREAGMGRHFHPKPIRQDGVSYNVRIADDSSRTMEPLNGLYTSKEIAQAFADTFERNTLPTWLRHYMKVNGRSSFPRPCYR